MGEASEEPKSDWANEDRALKEKLLRKYSKYISSLKHEFSNKKKKGKLPKEARQLLLEWWNIHYRWPYPTVSNFLIACKILQYPKLANSIIKTKPSITYVKHVNSNLHTLRIF